MQGRGGYAFVIRAGVRAACWPESRRRAGSRRSRHGRSSAAPRATRALHIECTLCRRLATCSLPCARSCSEAAVLLSRRFLAGSAPRRGFSLYPCLIPLLLLAAFFLAFSSASPYLTNVLSTRGFRHQVALSRASALFCRSRYYATELRQLLRLPCPLL